MAKALVLAASIFLAGVVVFVVGVFVADSELIVAEECTAEMRGPRGPIPPQRSLVRPSEKTVDLAAPGENKRAFRTRNDELLSRSPGAVSSEVVGPPQDKDGKLLTADVLVKAKAIGRGATVELDICAKRGGLIDAGTYTGQVEIYGPKLKAIRYGFAVTQRWYWAIPALLLILTVAVYLAVIWPSSLPPGTATTKTQKVAFGGIVVAGFAIAYFTVYLANPTWGDAIPGDVVGLLTAGFTATAAGTAFLVRQRGGDAGGEDGEPEEPAGPEPGNSSPPAPPAPAPPAER